MARLTDILSQGRFTWLRSIVSLMLREMATSYGRSPGGYIWAVAEPVAGLILLTIVFSFAFRSPPLGSNFALFYATGFLPFIYYTSLTSRVGLAIRFSRPLLAYPTVNFIDAIASRFLLNTITNLVVFMIVFTGIIVTYGLNVSIDFYAVAEALSMIALLALSLGTVNCYLFSVFPVWEQIWSILNRPMFFLSGIFFVLETVPEPFRSLLWYNPLVHVIAKMREGFYSTYDARLASPLYVYSTSLLLLLLGLLLLSRHHRQIMS
ncbi:ABC transporter permease [Cereibacter sphaeroides]|nr:ABC transporter permease [Cereibacter sphaeroides]MCE6950229.1 ABC transporter permease [Cereibacter sphaeroides]MCE6958653.1 ABC transporter permease [Cereibacter sphaeroides]MCE6967580.1 ABC transporter permease [Cereibacter sphaeroides]MCE6973464.1 ABC transporter permease [Cereibacter sphaeroides]